MPARGVIQSPVLVGRDDVLALSKRRLAEAAAGTGQLLFVAGEAGIGKTRLLSAVARHAQTGKVAVVRAAAFPGDTQASAGLFLDLASHLISVPDPALHDLGQKLSERVRAVSAAGDAHRRRRLLVQDLVDLLISMRPAGPVLMILEDLHWADQLSLEVLGHLAGRIASRPLLVAGAYRSDELYPDLPMRQVRARLLTQRLAEEVRLTRLAPYEVATMISTVLGRPAPATVIAAIHERSDGIPLHVEELLAAIDPDALTAQSSLAVRALAVPDTLGDAVLARARRLDPGTREVAAAAAVIGRSFDFDLLTAVTGVDQAEVARALRTLQEAFFILPGSNPATFDFRHALLRDALYSDTDLPLRRRLHERVAAAAARRGYGDAYVSAHLELGQCGDAAYRSALVAARAAAAMSAHREALELYQRAVRNMPVELAAPDRASLFTAVGDEAASADDNAAAADAYRVAHELLTGMGDPRTAAALVPRMVATAHLLGDGLERRVAALTTALASLTGVADADRERARMYAALAAAYMLDRRLDEAIEYGERGRMESQRIGDDEAAINAASTHGSVLVFAGRMDEGWRLLEDAVATAVGTQQEAEAARGYRMIGSCASVLVEADRATRWLTEGIRYAEGVELFNDRHYMASHLAHVQWATGAWDAATRTAQHALADGRGGITTRITAQYVLGYLAMGRGAWDAATDLLADSLALGERMAELQRLSPPLWGLAETARCRGDYETAVRLCERGYQASIEVTDAAYLFPYLLTGIRAHLGRDDGNAARAWLDKVGSVLTTRAIPGTLPALDHGRGLIQLAGGDMPAAERSLRLARQAWESRRRFWEGTWCRLDLAALSAKARRRAEAAKLLDEARAEAAAVGATVLLDATDRLASSLHSVPSAPRWHPLSAREYEVARLVEVGLTNRQIAERLVLAPKTISAHVEHILTKLGAARRAEIAAWCATIDREPSVGR